MAKQKGMLALSRLLSDLSDEENEIVFQCMSKAMKQAKRDLVQASPNGTGKYRKGWSVRTKRYKYGFDGVVYNRTAPRLTHLLEHPHRIRNQYGSYGETSPGHGQKEHIGPIRDKAEEYFIQLIVDAHE